MDQRNSLEAENSRQKNYIARSDPVVNCLLVRFGEITIREYPSIVGDNPGSNKGPPLAIDWNHVSETTVSVDEYEQHRPQRRDKCQMVLSSQRRWVHFKALGYSCREIVQATKQVNIARARRKRTKGLMHLSHIHERQEKIIKKIKNVLSGGRIKLQERLFLERFVKMTPNIIFCDDENSMESLNSNFLKESNQSNFNRSRVETVRTDISSDELLSIP